MDHHRNKMTEIHREKKLLRMIARQTLESNDAEWLLENLQKDWDWTTLAWKAFDEGIGALLYYHCRNLKLLNRIPDDTRIFLARIYTETLLINKNLLKQLDELEKKLSDAGIKVIIFKGAALLNTVYRDVALRPMEDMDLVVHPEQIEELKNVLCIMGFIQNRIYPESFKKGILCIDVHYDLLSSHRIQSRQQILDVKMSDVWEAAIPFEGSTSLCRLSVRDHLIALSYHLLKHRYERLIGFVDIAESLKLFQKISDRQALITYSKKIQADRILLYALLLTAKLISIDIPEELLAGLGKENLSTVEKYLLRVKVMRFRIGVLMDVLWMFQIRGINKKVRFAMENFFPRRKIMAQIFPETSHPRALLKRTYGISAQILSDLFILMRIALKERIPNI